MLRTASLPQAQVRSFRPSDGDGEHYILIEGRSEATFGEQLAQVTDAYQASLRSLGLDPGTAFFRRVYLSDAMNQAGTVRDLRLDGDECPTPVSIVQQAPLSGAKIALLAHHIDAGERMVKKTLSRQHVLIKRNGRRHLWSTRLCAADFDKTASSNTQTRLIFDELIDALSDFGATLEANCVRTWLYMRSVDVFYQGMVEARRDLFEKEGLTGATHYIASTGIEGSGAHRFDVVLMDAYSILDLDPRQVSYLNDFDMLCLTNKYNVTFERGTRIAYADRAHSFISGTASIDDEGNVVHVGDVMKQLERAARNVEALLQAGNAQLADLTHLIVYLRDPSDHSKIARRLGEMFPDLPAVVVQGAVCRPEWLVEIEGVAASQNTDETLANF